VLGFARRSAPGSKIVPSAGIALAAISGSTSSQTILQQVTPLIWVILAISAGGAIITYAFLVYAVWKFKDKSTRKRNYG
jgi:hypothetical protein